MTARAILTPRPNSAKFTDKVLPLDIPVKIGRGSKDDKPTNHNGFFDSKVLSKPHALLLHQGGQFHLLDTGSSNGTFVNNIRLSKPGIESEMTEIFTGDIIRFGSDILDKSRNIVQKPVILKITLFLESGTEATKRPAKSSLYRQSDSYEDILTVTQNLQDSLSREKMLEEKLIQIIKLIKAIEEKSETSNGGLHQEISRIITDYRPNEDDRKKFETLRSEKALLRKRNGELEEELASNEEHCNNLQKKATEDAKNMKSMGQIIEKLRSDICKLEAVVTNVKNTQEKVKLDYDETLRRERKGFQEELERVLDRERENDRERLRLEERVLYLMQFDPDVSRSSVASTPSTMRLLTLSRSEASTPSYTSNVFQQGTDAINTRGEIDDFHDILGGSDSEQSEEMDSVKFELQVTNREMELIKEKNVDLHEEITLLRKSFEGKPDVHETEKLRQELVHESSRAVELEIQVSRMEAEIQVLRGQALNTWIKAGEADFDSLFQDSENGNYGKERRVDPPKNQLNVKLTTWRKLPDFLLAHNKQLAIIIIPIMLAILLYYVFLQ